MQQIRSNAAIMGDILGEAPTQERPLLAQVRYIFTFAIPIS